MQAAFDAGHCLTDSLHYFPSVHDCLTQPGVGEIHATCFLTRPYENHEVVNEWREREVHACNLAQPPRAILWQVPQFPGNLLETIAEADCHLRAANAWHRIAVLREASAHPLDTSGP